jgi:predicted nucleic acid-binding protein
MILADTSIRVDHFRRGDPPLVNQRALRRAIENTR